MTLEAASISEASNGLIVADTLTTTTTGSTNLAGPNEITRFNGTSGGSLTLVDAGALQVTGIATTNDAITLTTDSLTNSGVITNGGGTNTANMILNADAFNLAGGTIEGGAAAVILRPRTGTQLVRHRSGRRRPRSPTPTSPASTPAISWCSAAAPAPSSPAT